MTEQFDVCLRHSGHDAKIRELCSFKEKMQQSETGTIDRLWKAIDGAKDMAGKKVGKGLAISLFVAIFSLVTGLFTLIYNSNTKVLTEIGDIKAKVAGIAEKFEPHNTIK